MPQTTNTDIVEPLRLAGIAVVILAIFLLIRLARFLNDFSQELKYINTEIRRTSGSERRYWLYKRRRLWLSLIPFVKY